MTVFIVSLFLPRTLHIDLQHSETAPRRPSLVRTATQIRLGDYHSAQAGNNTLSDAVQGLANTGQTGVSGAPGALLNSSSSENATRLHQFAKHLGLQPHEAHSPLWGRTSYFSQPKVSIPDTPPKSILRRGTALDQSTTNVPPNIPLPESRSSSHDRCIREADYSILSAEQGNSGLRNAINAVTRKGLLADKLWVGTLGMATDSLPVERREEVEAKLVNDFDCLVVWTSDSDFDSHYTHYCRTVLWPIFHYQIPDSPRNKAYLDHSWNFYKKVNQQFADHVVKHYKKGDVIWVHDYHLLLVPGMVRKKLPDAQIGFFLHVAFPSSEVFRCLAHRCEILEGLLGANLIGFQTHEYCLHFFQTCNRLLSAEATPHGIQLEDRLVDVATFPMGIDLDFLDETRAAKDVQECAQKLRERYEGKLLIIARDKLDQTRGVRQKLLAYELFLNKYAEYRDRVVMIQFALPTNEQSDVETSIYRIMSRINSAHSSLSHQPIIYLNQDLEYQTFLGMLSMASAIMITSLREGMNLAAHEFIRLQDGKYEGKKHGSLILSEFIGATSLLGDAALTINPWDHHQCAEAIRKALEMDPHEREQRWINALEIVTDKDAINWYTTFTERLAQAWDEHSRRDTVSIPRLSVNGLCKKYRVARNRLFLLDYEGTMATRYTSNGIILSSPQRTIDVLADLVEDPRNIVYVMSGCRPEELDMLFARVPGLGLIAENGCFLRLAGSKSWMDIADKGEVASWKESVMHVLEYYKERIEGSRIEERHCSLVLHYEDAKDSDAATKQAADCANHLCDACQGFNVHAINLDLALVVETLSWSKATAAELVFKRVRAECEEKGEETPEFLMVAGNARDDEVVYRWANGLGEAGTVRDVTTVSVSSRNTEAMSTLAQGVSGVLSTLNKLVLASA